MDATFFLPVLLATVVLFGLILLVRSARIVNQYEKGIVMRLGKFHGLVPSGLAIIMPLTDSVIRVDMREQVISVPPQKLITKDNVTVEVDAVVYYKVVDPVKSQFEVQDFGYACTTLALEAQGKKVRTAESLIDGGRLDKVPAAFVQADAQQCGFCTPGFVVALKAALDKNPNATPAEVEEALSGNICRCGTYEQMRHAIEALCKKGG